MGVTGQCSSGFTRVDIEALSVGLSAARGVLEFRGAVMGEGVDVRIGAIARCRRVIASGVRWLADEFNPAVYPAVHGY